MNDFVFSSESVTEGHPDKVADQISDAVLDAVLRDDPRGHVACETFVQTGLVLVGGEISTTTYVNISKLVREVVHDIGYTDPALGFDDENCAVLTMIDEQSPDINQGVETGGAGDQGMMFGYACRETEEMMPLPIVLAHRLTQGLATARKEQRLSFLKPDGKAQVSVHYADGSPRSVETVVVSCHHDKGMKEQAVAEGVLKEVVLKAIPEQYFPDGYTVFIREDRERDLRAVSTRGKGTMKILVNPTGKFEQGGPAADTGLTGRKIIVDTYGGWVPHGGGAFSGKDPSKVDRSAAYAARWVAKNIVAAGLAERCQVQLAYAIGVAEPVSINVQTWDTGKLSDNELEKLIRQKFCLQPRAIIEALDLLRPIYRKTTNYGHFGRPDPDFGWEMTDRVEQLA